MGDLEEKMASAFELFDKGEYKKAEVLYTACLREVKDKHSEKYNHILHMLGFVKASLNKFSEAREIYSEHRDLARSVGDVEEEAMALHQLGMTERMGKNFEEALHFFQTELQLLEKHGLDSDLKRSANLYEQGYIHLQLRQLEEAKELMKKSLESAEHSGDPIAIGCALRGLGEIYKAQRKKERADKYFSKAIAAFQKAGDLIAVKEVEELQKA